MWPQSKMTLGRWVCLCLVNITRLSCLVSQKNYFNHLIHTISIIVVVQVWKIWNRTWHAKNYDKNKYAVVFHPISISLSRNVMAYWEAIPPWLITPPWLVVLIPVGSSYWQSPEETLSHLLTREADSIPLNRINLTLSHHFSRKILLARFSCLPFMVPQPMSSLLMILWPGP